MCTKLKAYLYCHCTDLGIAINWGISFSKAGKIQ